MMSSTVTEVIGGMLVYGGGTVAFCLFSYAGLVSMKVVNSAKIYYLPDAPIAIVIGIGTMVCAIAGLLSGFKP